MTVAVVGQLRDSRTAVALQVGDYVGRLLVYIIA